MGNEELILGIRNGSEKHFKALFDAQHARIYAVARQLGLSHEAGQDIVQEVFVRLWNQRATLREDLSVSGLLQTIASRLLHRKIRRLLLESDYLTYLRNTGREAANETGQQVTRNEIGQVLLAALKQLPERRKAVFLLSYRQELTAEEIARTLKISVRTTENQLYRARRFLRAYFGQHGFSMQAAAPVPGGLLLLLVMMQHL